MDLEYCYERLEYAPHRGQRLIHEAARKYRNLCVLFGRRGGKSHCTSFEGVLGLLEPPHPVFGSPCVLVTAPSADLTKAVFERAHDLIFKQLSAYRPHFNRTERFIELRKLGSTLFTRSGDKPKSLVSRGYSKVIIDESGFFRDESFRELKPALLERQGQLIAIGVPMLQNWYYDLYKDAKRKDPDTFQLQLPSIVNPAISLNEWHKLFRTTSRAEFLRQYCAKFQEISGTVWKLSDLEKIKGSFYENFPISGFDYFAGVDFARKQDNTVVTIAKRVNKFVSVVDKLTLHGGNWASQMFRIADFLNYWNVTNAYCDATGIGDALIEQLADKTTAGITPFIFTNETKTDVIDILTVKIEADLIEIPEQLIEYHNELKIYEFEISKTGLRIFNAPEGYHDDHVISLALAVTACERGYFE